MLEPKPDPKDRQVYTLSADAKGEKPLTKLLPVPWFRKSCWFAPKEGEEEIWAGSARPEWYWQTVAAAVASYRKPTGSTDAELLAEGFRCVFLAVTAELKVPAPAVLPDIAKRVHFFTEDGIGRVLRIDSVPPQGLSWESVLPWRNFGQLAESVKGEELLKSLEECGITVHQGSSGTSYNPALSRARNVAVFKDIEKDTPPPDVKYRLALEDGRHPLARRHLLAHELTHAHSGRACGLQAEDTAVDEAYTETLARMVTDTITAGQSGVSGADLTDPAKRDALAEKVQYNVYCEASRATEQEKGALRYQKNIWGLVRVAFLADADGRSLGVPLTEQLARYLQPDAPALPTVLEVVAQAPGDSAVLSRAAPGSATSVPLELYLPDTDEADYHLLLVHGADAGRARTVLVDGGCVGSADAEVQTKKLAEVLALLPKGSANRPVLDLVLITGDMPRRYNLLPAATKDIDIGAVHYAGAPGRDRAPLPPTGGTICQWLTAHQARPFPAAFSSADRPFATLGPATLQVLGANLTAGGADAAGGSALVLVSAGGLRLVLTSDADAAAARAADALCAVPGGPRLFTAPAALTVVTGRPDPDAARAWPWVAPAGAPLLLPVAATGDRPADPGTPPRRTAAASLAPKAQPLSTVILQLPETTLTIPPPADDGGSP
ncbi:hypothetical protein [Streptomyces sp. NBC_01477]|uniref:hypothetical protein n=1 Tax=Streptomyces sp. NBC_01477 TaxID=2976015 RepID=UPI002E301A57|nr:hypothetical protein [Streptomyces sp. NBC_01477]